MEGGNGTSSNEQHSLFFKLSLGLSLSGMSCLGYVLPNILKHHHFAFMYIFSLTTGVLVSAVTSFVPTYVITNDLMPITQFYYLQSLMFIVMLLLDEIDDCAKGWSKVAEDLIRDEMARHGIMDNDYDIELSRRYNRPMSGGTFSRVETNDDSESAYEVDDANRSNENENNDDVHCNDDNTLYDCSGNRNDVSSSSSSSIDVGVAHEYMATKVIVRPVLVGARVKALSSMLLIAIGIALGVSEGLYIGYKDDMTAILVEKLLTCTMFMSLSMSFYLIVSGGNAIVTITCLVFIYALAPLIGTCMALDLFTLQGTLVRFNSQVHAMLCTLLSGGLLYLSLSFMTPIALGQKESDHDDHQHAMNSLQRPSSSSTFVNKTGCVICFSVGFILVNGYGSEFTNI